MKKQQILAAGLVGTGLVMGALAADRTFPTVNGDLASESDWGGSLPGTSDTVIINTAGNGYTVGQDVTFGNIKFTAPNTTKITAGDAHINLKTGTRPLDMDSETTKKRYMYLSGGTWDLNNAEWKGLYTDCWLYLQDGAVVTNMADLYVSSLAYTGTRLFLQNGSRVYCKDFNVCNTGNSGLLSVESGSSLVSSGTCYIDRGGSGTRAATLRVMGEGSSVTCTGVQHGYKGSGSTINILDGGSLTCTSIRVTATGNAYKNNVIRMSGGTLDVSGDLAFNSTAASSGYGLWATNSSIRIGGNFSGNAEGGFYDFQDVKLTVVGSATFFDAAKGGTTVRFGGSKGTVPATFKTAIDVFPYVKGGGKCFNTFIIDDGFRFVHDKIEIIRSLCYTHDSTFRVTGGGLFDARETTMTVGHSNYNTSISNRVEVLDGGKIEVADFRLMGKDNTLVVSNGTVQTDVQGIMLGYNYTNPSYPTSGSRVILQGATPLLDCASAPDGTLWMKNGNAIHIEIPAQGYAAGYAPIRANGVTFDSNATLTVDYAAFLVASADEAHEVTLMTFKQDVSQRAPGGVTFAQWLKNQADAMDLPKGCKLHLIVDANGTRVVFRAGPPPGMMVLIR